MYVGKGVGTYVYMYACMYLFTYVRMHVCMCAPTYANSIQLLFQNFFSTTIKNAR